jgi:hypothetical protein
VLLLDWQRARRERLAGAAVPPERSPP